MNGNVTDLLREGLDRLTADVQVPPGVTGRARARLRRKKTAARAALAAGTAGLTAAAVVAVMGTGQGVPRPGTRTAAYVISQVETALATTTKVVQTKTTFSAPFPPVVAWNYRSDMRLTQSGFIAPALAKHMPWAQGRVHWAVGIATAGGKRIYAQIDYRHRRWANAGMLGFTPNACATRLDIVEFNAPGRWEPYLRQALACGLFKVTGHARVDGVPTVKLSGSTVDRHFWTSKGEGRGPLVVAGTLYVNPKTYLPVLMIWRNLSHYRDGSPLTGTVRQEIRALPASTGNIARASVTIPAGFRKVPGGAFGGPVWPYFTSG